MTVPAAFGDPAEPSPRRGGPGLTVLAIVGWVAVVGLAWWLGRHHRIEWKLRAAPLAGFADRHVTPATFAVLAFGLGLAWWLPGWARRVPWCRLLLGTGLVAVGWGIALGATRGANGLDRGLASRHEYPAVVSRVDEIGVRRFVETFTDDEVLRHYPIHVQGHPVGTALLFVALDRVGLTGGAGGAAFILVVSASAFVAVLTAVREVAGEVLARRSAPFLSLAPALVWWVTSTDALFATVAAWAITCMVLATRAGWSMRWRIALALGSGLLWGLGLNLSYGLVPVALIGAGVVVARRRWTVLAWAGVGAAVVMGAFAVGGFSWWEGLAATKVRYSHGVASARPYGYFALLGNPAAIALAVGPAAWVAALRVKERGLLVLGGMAWLAMGLADLTGLSKAEVERIWLPFVPWLLVLCAGLADPAALLLCGQVLVAVAVETIVKTPW